MATRWRVVAQEKVRRFVPEQWALATAVFAALVAAVLLLWGCTEAPVAESDFVPQSQSRPAGRVLRLGDVDPDTPARRTERRAVTVGSQFGDDLQVLAGLSAGERVVIEGGDQLADGDRVKESDS